MENLSNNEKLEKVYQFYGLNVAIALLRPGSKYEASGTGFLKWDDPRPCPSWEEVEDTMKKIKDFEDSINTIYTKDQLKQINKSLDTMVK